MHALIILDACLAALAVGGRSSRSSRMALVEHINCFGRRRWRRSASEQPPGQAAKCTAAVE
jgi:hypothetical protein